MKGKTILVRCIDMKDVRRSIDFLYRALQLSDINSRVNFRKNEITIHNTKLRFVAECHNKIGMRFDHWFFSKELEKVMPKIIKTILDEK